jgi:hypothetical protein
LYGPSSSATLMYAEPQSSASFCCWACHAASALTESASRSPTRSSPARVLAEFLHAAAGVLTERLGDAATVETAAELARSWSGATLARRVRDAATRDPNDIDLDICPPTQPPASAWNDPCGAPQRGDAAGQHRSSGLREQHMHQVARVGDGTPPMAVSVAARPPQVGKPLPRQHRPVGGQERLAVGREYSVEGEDP